MIFGRITAGVKTISITIEDGFGGNVRKPNEFLGKVLGASARSVYTGYAIQMGPISFLGVGYLSMFGGVLERGIEGLISGYGLKGSWNYAIEDGRVLSDFAGGLLFAGLTVVASKLLGAFLYGGSQENYYTKSIIPELPYQGYGLTPGGMQLPQGMEAGRGSREAAAFLMNLWQITGQNRAFLPGSKPLELGDGSKGSGNLGKNKIEHVLKSHTAGRMQNTVDAMMEKGLRDAAENLVNSKGFFNTSWSDQTVIDAVNQAYKEALTKGIPSGAYDYTTTVFGENITLNFQDGVFKSAWGDYKLNLNDFGY